MLKLITLIPTKYNTGEKVGREIFQRFETRLIEIAGGFSSEGFVEGGWEGPDGKIYRDKTRKYSIAADEAKIEELKTLIKEIGKELKQEAMYVEISRPEIEFLN